MPAPHPLLKRTSAPANPVVSPLPDLPDIRLALGRVHEACGTARVRFALWIAAKTTGPILWISPGWSPQCLTPSAMAHLIDPARLVLVAPARAEDILWCMEEVLRSGSVALAVAELPDLPNLTQVRRMHLAAENGAQTGHLPLGLLLTPGTGGAPGVETRWQLTPQHAAETGRWRLERIRARTAPPAHWMIRQTSNGAYAQDCRAEA